MFPIGLSGARPQFVSKATARRLWDWTKRLEIALKRLRFDPDDRADYEAADFWLRLVGFRTDDS
jgi:hypothetical protein